MRCPRCLVTEMDEFHDHYDGKEKVKYKCPHCGHEETHVYRYKRIPRLPGLISNKINSPGRIRTGVSSSRGWRDWPATPRGYRKI